MNALTGHSAKAIVLLVVVGLFIVTTLSCSTDRTAEMEQHKLIAAELANNQLHRAAVAEYEKILAMEGVSAEERGNICYMIGRIYYRDIEDFGSAAAYFVRAREYAPETSYAAEASKNLVACLEKLGNFADARRQLNAATDIDAGPANDSDVVVARVGEREIWLSEIDRQISQLPREMQEQLTEREAKLQYVRQYVGVELLYNAAIREDYVSRPDIQRQREQMMKQLLVEQYVAEKVMPQVKGDTLDVRNFYLANKDSRYGGAPFDSVRMQVYMDYQSDKAEAAYNDYISALAKAENVQFFDRRVK